MKNKKAQGLPMNTIVIAALVLVVMIVLILIFTGNIGGWRGDIEDTETSAMARAECLGKGGIVRGDCEDETEKSTPISNLGINLKCCVKKTSEERCNYKDGKWQNKDDECDKGYIESFFIPRVGTNKCCLPEGDS